MVPVRSHASKELKLKDYSALTELPRDQKTVPVAAAFIWSGHFFGNEKMSVEEYDLVILGGGTGLTVAAWTFAAEGRRVAVI